MTTQTDSIAGADTKAKVFISLYGEKNKIIKHPLQKPESGQNPFEKEAKDVFHFSDVDVGRVRANLFSG